MKKFLIALMFLASTLMFAQDGRTKVNFYNQTGSTLRFMLNGNPVCTGDVIPGGFCTEPVNPGSYTASATDGQQTTGGQSFDIAYGETYNYRVFVRDTAVNVAPGLVLVEDLDYHAGFTVNAPVTLTKIATGNAKTDKGVDYTQTMFAGSVANGDVYVVGVGVYPFALSTIDNEAVLEGYRKSAKGTILQRMSCTISGQPGIAVIIGSKDDKGRELRFGVLATFKGNTEFLFIFGSYLDVTTTDMDAMKLFFSSARLN